MKEDNVILTKSLDFAVRIVNVYKYLCNEKKEYVLARQLLRSGTSVGANVREAVCGQSRSDFIAKMSIALKEVSETEYWLELLERTGYLTTEQFEGISADCGEIARILTAILKSAKEE